MPLNRSEERTWMPTDHHGIAWSFFRANESGGRSSVVRLAHDAPFPRHSYQRTEVVVVLEGSVRIGGVELAAGDCLFTEPGGEHDVVAITAATIFVSSTMATPVVERPAPPCPNAP